MAWHFARYAEAVAAAGKREYALPMFVNAALIRPGHQPGQYPSGGPLPHLVDVWRAAAPSIDFLAPDIYFQNFVEWARRYTRLGQSAVRSGGDAQPRGVGQRALRHRRARRDRLLAVRHRVDRRRGGEAPRRELRALAQLEPLILSLQGKGVTAGLLSEGPEQRQPQQVRLGDYVLLATFESGAPPSLADGVIVPTGAAGRTAAALGRARPRDGAGRAHRRRHGRHDHLRPDSGGPAGRHPERRGGPVRRRTLGEHPLAERRRDAPGAPRAARAGALLDPAREALHVLTTARGCGGPREHPPAGGFGGAKPTQDKKAGADTSPPLLTAYQYPPRCSLPLWRERHAFALSGQRAGAAPRRPPRRPASRDPRGPTGAGS